MAPIPRVLLGLAGLATTGEAAALTIGLRLRQPDHAWVGVKNDLFLALDLLGGIALVLAVLIDAPRPWVLVLGGLLVLTHGWRAIEPLAPVEPAFAANTALVIVNLLKLALAGAGLWWLLRGE